MKYFRSKILIAIVVLSAAVTILMWNSIVATAFSFYFKNYFKTEFDASVSVEQVQRKKNAWVLKNTALSFPGGDLNAKQIEISYRPFFMERRVEVFVNVIDPLFKLTDQTLAVLDSLKKLKMEDGLLDYQVFVEIKNGCAVAEHLPTLYFGLKDELGPYSRCCFQGGFSDTNQVQGSYSSQSDHPPHMELTFHDFDLAAASKWMEHLHPGVLEWTSQSGRVEGNWSIDDDYYYGSGDLKVTDLTLTSIDNPFSIHIPSLATSKEDKGTTIVLEKKGKLGVLVEEDFPVDLYHFGGELFLNPSGELQGALAGAASIGAFQPELDVKIAVNQMGKQDLFRYTVKGPLKAFFTKAPQKYQHVLEEDFADVEAELTGCCFPITRGVEFTTEIKLFKDEEVILDDFRIFCRIDPTTSQFIDEGNFVASSVNLEMILSPLLFVDKQFTLTGKGYFEGAWTPALLHVKYRPMGAVLESEVLSLDIPGATEDLPGEHFFDFERNHQYGRLYIENGMYLERGTNLAFTDLCTQLVFEGKSLHATHVETSCQGIDFKGMIGLDYSSPLKKTFDLNLIIEKMEGKVSQFQSFLSHFPQSRFLQRLPFEGTIMNGRSANKIFMRFINGKCLVAADITGFLVEGHTCDPSFSVRADKLSFEFAYNHDNRTFGMKNLGGNLRLGLPGKEKVFRVQGEGFQFRDYQKHEGEFSIALRDDRHEWMKLAGEISPATAHGKGDCVRVTFDPGKSHLQNGQSIHCRCEISDWENIEDIEVSFHLKVPDMMRELQQGMECGLISLPEPFETQINEWMSKGNTQGQLFLSIAYDRLTSLINIQARGDHVQLGDRHVDQIHLEAKKRHHIWMIEQLKFDDISLSADLQKSEENWKLNFLGVRYGEALLAGLDGVLSPEDREVKARINLFELDLKKMSAFSKLKEFMAGNAVSGELKGAGELCFKLKDEAPGWACDILGSLNTRSVVVKDIALEDADNVSFQLLSDRIFSLRNFKTKALGVNWLIEKCCYNPRVKQFEMENVAFRYPVNQGAIWMTALQYYFPEVMDQQMMDVVSGLKREGDLAGTFDFSYNENMHQFQLKLEDGMYYWKNDPYNVRHFSVLSTPTEKAMLFQTVWEKILPWVYIRTGNGEKGTVVLADQNPFQTPTPDALVVEWRNPPEKSLMIEKMKGSSFGITVDLEQRGGAHVGSVAFCLPEMAPLLSEEYLKNVQKAQFKGNYVFEGAWTLPFFQEEWLKHVAFEGTFCGSHCVTKGFCYAGIEGNCSLIPGKVHLHECTITDPASQGTLQDLFITYEDNEKTSSRFHLNQFQLNNLRPFLLKRDPPTESFSKKTLNINQLVVSECSGELANTETYTGRGFLQFMTETKKGIESTPFALPAEIISRIGLNSSIMTPVKGTAIFEIANGRCYIPKLKNTYSQGKLSKFYIYSSKEPSYVDFDGNVHIQIRIKHYNLLFKLSEMLTFNIRGTLQKPLYYLQKQPK